jgi:Acyl-CoA oxidase
LEHFREDTRKHTPTAADSGAVLGRVLQLFCVNRVHNEMSLFLEHGYLTPAHAKQIRVLSVQLAKELRTQAVPLSDAFNYPDFILRAPMGRFDGNIYSGELLSC